MDEKLWGTVGKALAAAFAAYAVYNGMPAPAPPPPPPPDFFSIEGLQAEAGKAAEFVATLDVPALIDDCHLTVDALFVTLLLCSIWANHMWRIICFVLGYKVLVPLAASLAAANSLDGSCPIVSPWSYLLWPAFWYACLHVPCSAWLNSVHTKQPVGGAVFVTGADSGMGWWTAAQLAGAGYTVYAGCFSKGSSEKLRAKVVEDHGHEAAGRLVEVTLDVTSDESVARAAKQVEAAKTGLVGIINCAGMGFNGPSEYFPMEMLKQQMEVNFYGYVRVVQALMPILKKTVTSPGARRGRVVCIGTGGGVGSPSPPLLFAYMASKWSIEAFVQVRDRGLHNISASCTCACDAGHFSADHADGDADAQAAHRRVRPEPGLCQADRAGFGRPAPHRAHVVQVGAAGPR